MNINRLKDAEAQFLKRYPGGFSHPLMLAISEKHKMEKRIEQANKWFAEDQFLETDEVIKNIAKMVNTSSLVSMFEKPKFRDVVKQFAFQDKNQLAYGLQCWLHENEKDGFNMMLRILKNWEVAKWPILTLIPTYFRPTEEVFIKPTTAKGIIDYFEVKNLKYSPKPSWQFYSDYRNLILEMRENMDSQLTENNAAFCGFLMTTIEMNK